MTFQSETRELSAGTIRYHYNNDEIENECQAVVVILGVGTAMRVEDYDKLAVAMVEGTSIVVILADHSPKRWFGKQNSVKFANLANEIVDRFTEIIVPAHNKHHLPLHGFLVGGHSSGGQAAIGALPTATRPSLYAFEPAGLLGLDPYKIDSSSVTSIALPAMFWGFTKTTCLVSVEKAAKPAYKASSTDYRVLYLIQNDNDRFVRRPPSHCIFTDHGCAGRICPVHDEQAWIRTSVGKSFQTFVLAIAENTFDRSQFELHQEGILLFVNTDNVA